MPPPTPTTRASLLLKLRDPQDHAAWLEFVALYEPVIYRMLRKAGLGDADALDVMQELLLAVNRSIDRWDPCKDRGSFRGWLRRVTRNLVVSWVRRQKRQVTTSSVDLDELLDLVPEKDGPETDEFDQELQRAQFRQASLRVQSEVAPHAWQAFHEVSIAGNSVADTAAKLKMSVGAVRVAKCRVIARLREVVAEMET